MLEHAKHLIAAINSGHLAANNKNALATNAPAGILK
jgi:hypothetical protein